MQQHAALVNKHVHDVYNHIAAHFDQTRGAKWTGVIEFLARLPDNALVLDIGCGNGKYHGYDRLKWVGLDSCKPLLEIAQSKHKNAQYVLGNGLDLPFESASFDACISVAVLHHLPTVDMRKRFIDEALRVLRPRGMLLITVWADSDNGDKRKCAKWKPLEDGEKGDYLVPWTERNTNDTHFRYYHLFEKDEMYELVKSTIEHKGARVVNLEFEHDNWNMIVQKQ